MKRKNIEDFNVLIRLYQNEIYSLALYMLGGPKKAIEATQNIFFTAFETLSTCPQRNFKPQLFAVAAKACLTEKINKRGGETTGFESPNQEISGRILNLPAKERLILILSDIHQMSYEEIGHVMQCPPNAVKSKLSNARRTLSELLFKHGTEEIESNETRR